MTKPLKILILTEAYPTSDGQSMAFVHSRNLSYLKAGHQVSVLSFEASNSYHIDGLLVLSQADFSLGYKLPNFDIVVSHAPNLRHHLRFILKNKLQIKNIVFVIHGHEVLITPRYYPPPYKRMSSVALRLKEIFGYAYDQVKVLVLRVAFESILKSKSHFIFVSQWMKEQFLSNLNIDNAKISKQSDVIHNSVHPIFELENYDFEVPKKADFITIRHFDSSKYAIDLVVKAAFDNPNSEFHLYGKGEYFDHYEAPVNLKIIKKFFNHEALPAILNQYRAALMPTRLDSQGVMVCEMATFGIPVVTSDLALTREILEGFSNIEFIRNENFLLKASDFKNKINKSNFVKNKKFFTLNTVQKEIELFQRISEREAIK